MTEPAASKESIDYQWSPSLAGVEVLDVRDSARPWRVFNVAPALAVPRTWHADVDYRGRRHAIQPGQVFCSEAGEVHTVRRVGRAGDFRALLIAPDVLGDYVAEHLGRPRSVHWRAVAHSMSAPLSTALSRFFAEFRPEVTPVQQQSNLVEVIGALIEELIDGGSPSLCHDADARAAARIRECLHEEGRGTLDLTALAEKTGMSRFRLLRTFKRRYGLPAHAYQLCVRVFFAKTLLRQGHSPSQVALRCGFVDQSHMGRHFKQLLGVTPARVQRTLEPPLMQ